MTTVIAAESEKATCKACKKEFLIIQPEKIFYTKKGLPNPELCPDCRRQRRLSLRNERKLFKRKCDNCKKDVISTYRADSPYKVYCQECFWKYLG